MDLEGVLKEGEGIGVFDWEPGLKNIEYVHNCSKFLKINFYLIIMSRCCSLMVKNKLYFFFLIAITVGTEGQSSLLLFHTGRPPAPPVGPPDLGLGQSFKFLELL